MAETLVKNPSCSKCGEDARPEALFCHACGGEIIDLPKDEEGNISSAWYKEDIMESAVGVTSAAAERQKVVNEEADVDNHDANESPAVAEEPIIGDEDKEDKEGKEVETVVKVKRKEIDFESKSETIGKKKLTSASDLRKHPKSIRTKRVEIVWEENTNSANWVFLLFGLLFAILGGVVFFLAFYLK